MTTAPSSAHHLTPDEIRACGWACSACVIFALTLPMTRLAVGTPEAPQLSGLFVAFGRAAVAGAVGLFFLAHARAAARAGATGR